LGSGSHENHIGQCRVDVRWSERTGLCERMGCGEGRTRGVPGIRPVRRRHDASYLDALAEADVAACFQRRDEYIGVPLSQPALAPRPGVEVTRAQMWYRYQDVVDLLAGWSKLRLRARGIGDEQRGVGHQPSAPGHVGER